MNFHETRAGDKFFRTQLPTLTKALQDIAAALSRPSPICPPIAADPQFLSSLYYGDYEADVFKQSKEQISFDRAVTQAETALRPLLSCQAAAAFDGYQDAVLKRRSALLEQTYASGYRTAVQMFVAGLNPQPPISSDEEAEHGGI